MRRHPKTRVNAKIVKKFVIWRVFPIFAEDKRSAQTGGVRPEPNTIRFRFRLALSLLTNSQERDENSSLPFCCRALLLASCGGNQVRAKRPAAPAEPKEYTYGVRAVHPHPATSYTQGLQYADGRLWEGTGQHGESVVQTLDLATGRAEVFARLPKEDFGEGIALLDGKVYQLTWQSNKAYVYDARTGGENPGVPLSRRGLGPHDRREEALHVGRHGKHLHARPGHLQTRKAYHGDASGASRSTSSTNWSGSTDKIWANVYTTDQIVIIDPGDGRRWRGSSDLSGLLPEEDDHPGDRRAQRHRLRRSREGVSSSRARTGAETV